MRPTDRRREGNDYIVTWESTGLELVFSRTRETASSIYSEVVARVAGGGGRVMAPTKVNLFEMAGRGKLAAMLLDRVEGGPSLKDWQSGMEYAYSYALDCFRDLGELIDLSEHTPREEHGYLFDRVIVRNELNILVADQGASKSYLLLYLLVCSMLGLPSIFGTPTVTGPAIYYDTETSADAHKRRLDRICSGLKLPRVPRIKYRRLHGRLIDHEAFITAEVAREGATTVAIDSLTYAAGGDLNDMGVAGPTINMIADIGDSVTKLVAAHHSKQQRGGQPGDASAIGSALFELKARALWVLNREASGGSIDTRDMVQFNVLMTNKKMSDGPTERQQVYAIAFDNARKSTTFERGQLADLRELQKDLSPTDRVYHLLQREEPLTVKEAAAALDIKEGSMKRLLNEMALQRLAKNLNRSAGGAGNAGQWVHIPPAERPEHNRSTVQPPNNPHLNGSGAPDGANRSGNRSPNRSEPFSRTVDPSRVGNPGLAATGTDDIEELKF